MQKLITNIFYSLIGVLALGFAMYAPSFTQNAVTGAKPQLYAKGEIVAGYVVGVMDGDTLKLLTDDKRELRVRIEAIDAPEKGQEFSDAAKRSLSDLAYGKPAQVYVLGFDPGGRVLGQVYIGTMDLSVTQIGRGMAWVNLQAQIDNRLIGAETRARNRQIGLWTQQQPEAPWEYRRTHGDQI